MTVNVKTTVVVIRPLPKVISHPPVIITNGISITSTISKPMVIKMSGELPSIIYIYLHSLIMAPRAPNIMERLFRENRSLDSITVYRNRIRAFLVYGWDKWRLTY